MNLRALNLHCETGVFLGQKRLCNRFSAKVPNVGNCLVCIIDNLYFLSQFSGIHHPNYLERIDLADHSFGNCYKLFKKFRSGRKQI